MYYEFEKHPTCIFHESSVYKSNPLPCHDLWYGYLICYTHDTSLQKICLYHGMLSWQHVTSHHSAERGAHVWHALRDPAGNEVGGLRQGGLPALRLLTVAKAGDHHRSGLPVLRRTAHAEVNGAHRDRWPHWNGRPVAEADARTEMDCLCRDRWPAPKRTVRAETDSPC